MKTLAILAVVTSVCSLVLAAVALERSNRVQEQGPGSLRVSRVEVVDAAGKTRVLLSAESGGQAGLSLYDAAENPRVGLAVGNDGIPQLLMKDAAGKGRLALVVLPSGPGIGWSDATGKVRTSLGMADDGRTALSMKDAAGTQRLALGLSPDGSPGLTLRSHQGR